MKHIPGEDPGILIIGIGEGLILVNGKADQLIILLNSDEMVAPEPLRLVIQLLQLLVLLSLEHFIQIGKVYLDLLAQLRVDPLDFDEVLGAGDDGLFDALDALLQFVP